MRLQIKQWGNSKALRLPKDLISAMSLDTGDFLELNRVDDQTIKLVIMPKSEPKKRLTLAERVAMTSVDTLPVAEEWDLLEPTEKEI